jgi:hypothetical protein
MREYPDAFSRHCPRLGSEATFAYCRTCPETGEGCPRIFDCWWETFDVEAYLRDTLSEDEFDRLVHAKLKPKVSLILDLISQAGEKT